jgi:hypothetical protein
MLNIQFLFTSRGYGLVLNVSWVDFGFGGQ